MKRFYTYIRLFLLVATIIATMLPATANAQNRPLFEPPVSLTTEVYAFAAPDSHPAATSADRLVVLTLVPDDGWYTYANDPGSIGQPTVVTAEALPGKKSLTTYYPAGKPKPDPLTPQMTVNVFEGTVRIFVPVPAGTAKEGLRLDLSALYCTKTSCLPVKTSVTVPAEKLADTQLPKAATQPFWPEFAAAAPGTPETPPSGLPSVTEPAPLPREPQPGFTPRQSAPGLEVSGMWKAMLLAFLAGFILNFMPCVLPVASLKLKGIMSGCLNTDDRDSTHCFRRYNICFALGILVYFFLLSIILSTLGLAWGQIFQKPAVVLGLAVLVFALSLSLFGVFHLPVIDLKAPSGGGHFTPANAFFTGALATLLATPCSGPFLGGVLAWALLQPPLFIALTFLCIGLGMASPYMFMALKPSLLAPFTAPVTWGGFIEKLAGFFLMGTCIYLLNILPETMLLPALLVLFVTAFAAWIWGGWTGLSHSLARRAITRTAAALLVITAMTWALTPKPEKAVWQDYDPAAFSELLGKQPVLVDFTADWCPTCKLLESAVLTDDNLARWKKDYGLVFVKVDLTEENEERLEFLRQMGSQSIPVVAIFPAGEASAQPLVLRDLFTTSTLEKALEGELASGGRGR